MNRSAALSLLLVGFVAACADSPTDPTLASSEVDLTQSAADRVFLVSTESEFRNALAADLPREAVRVVRIAEDLDLSATLRYEASQPLRIDGGGATITGPLAGNALSVRSAAALSVMDVVITGAAAHGIHVEVPAGATDDVRVELVGSTLRANGQSGLWIDDQIHDTAAGIRLVVRNSRIEGNGYRAGAEFADFDGIRVNEGGLGNLELSIEGSSFVHNAADALELDETGAGDVHSVVQRSTFSDNGDQPQNREDLEDGFDIDEAGEGSIHAQFLHVVANGNHDEGIDLDEEGAGDIVVKMIHVKAALNQDANIAFTEDEEGEVGGDVTFHFSNVTARDSRDDDGVKIEEFGPGDLRGRMVRSSAIGNADDGIQVEQNGPGEGSLRLQHVRTAPNADDPVNSSGVHVVSVGMTR